MRIIALIIIALVFVFAQPMSAKGKLDSISDSAAGKKSDKREKEGGKKHKKEKREKSRHHHHDSTAEEIGCMIKTAEILFFLPSAAVGDNWTDHGTFLPGQSQSVPVAASAALDASYYDNVKIASLGFDAAFQRMELRVVGSRVEEWPQGAPRDFFHLAKADLGIRFANSPYFNMRFALGARGLFDTARDRHFGGMNFRYGFNFNAGRVTGRADAEIGGYGEAFAAEFKGTLGLYLDGIEVYAGYQNLDIAGVALGGPLAGLRMNF